MIWLKAKQWLWNALAYALPYFDGFTEASWWYRFSMWIYENGYRAELDLYEAGLPLRITPPPGDDPF